MLYGDFDLRVVGIGPRGIIKGKVAPMTATMTLQADGAWKISSILPR